MEHLYVTQSGKCHPCGCSLAQGSHERPLSSRWRPAARPGAMQGEPAPALQPAILQAPVTRMQRSSGVPGDQ
jgi:hypothetical protein